MTRAGQAEDVAKRVEQRQSWIDRELVGRAVDEEAMFTARDLTTEVIAGLLDEGVDRIPTCSRYHRPIDPTTRVWFHTISIRGSRHA